jgi:ACS family hexuronate transporter-like MFS transporter
MLSSELIAYLVTHHGYRPIFFLMAVMHPFAIVLLWKVFKMGPHMKLAPLLGGAAGASDSVRT